MKLVDKYFLDIYILLWCVYMLQQVFGIRGVISANIFLILVVVSICLTLYVVIKMKKTLYVKGLVYMLIMVTIYGGYHMFAHKYTYSAFYVRVSSFAYLQMFFRSILPFFVFYLITSRKNLSNKDLIRYFIYFFITYTWSFYSSAISDFDNQLELKSTLNVGYRIAGLIPLLFLLKINENIKLGVLFLIVCFVILSSKRGAMIMSLVMSWFFLRNSIRAMSKKKILLYSLIIIILITVMYYFVIDMYNQSTAMQTKWERTMMGDSSGRNELYSYFSSYILNQMDPMSFFFGNGADSTLNIMGYYAHNDWLEIGMNQGLLGLTVYLFYWLLFYKEWKYKKMKNDYDLCILCMLVSYLLISFFSMSINDMPHCATFALAFAITSKYKLIHYKTKKRENHAYLCYNS